MRKQQHHGNGNLRLCPTDPEHGHLLAVEGMPGLYCPHQSHDGRPAFAGHRQVISTKNRWMLDDPALGST